MRVMDDRGVPVRLYELSTDLGEEDQQSSLRAFKPEDLLLLEPEAPSSNQ